MARLLHINNTKGAAMNTKEIEDQRQETEDALAALDVLVREAELAYEKATEKRNASSWHYTPGPWHAEPGRRIVTKNGSFAVEPIGGGDDFPWSGGFDELDDNAKLVAAAPQLLEACQLLQSYWSRGLWPDADSEVADVVAAAVRKTQWRNSCPWKKPRT